VRVPKEIIWQDLRNDCLDAIPEGSRVSLSDPINLAAWQKRGYYVVSGTTAKQFQLIAPADDFGSALLTDVECLLDNAAEHQVSLWQHIHSPGWLSPAWLSVTVYYWAFYLSLAITRLTGRTAWFLTKEITRDLRTLGPTVPAAPGAGCFKLMCGAPVNSTDRELILEKTKSRIHDEIWQLWFDGCSSRMKRLKVGSGNSAEERLFTAVARSAKTLGEDWPSAFRNAINYRSGFAYTAVRRVNVLKSFGYLKQPSTYDMTEILDRFERSVVVVKTSASILLAPQVVLELLVDLTFILHAIANELHRELVDRHRLDGRWRIGRQQFLQKHGLNTKDGDWPL
jgi:hypothetical protein